MKRILFIHVIALLSAVQSYAQNSLNSGDFSGGTWGTGQAMTASAGTSLIITKAVTTSGDVYFRFFGDGSPCGEYQPNTNADFFTHSTVVTAPNGNCGNANAWRINVPTTTSQVVFKTDGQNDGIDAAVAFVIQGTIQTVSNVYQNAVIAGSATTITAALSGSLSTGQAVYLRYTTNAFSTSTVVQMTGSGTTYTADIPAGSNAQGNTVQYYVFTSGTANVASNGSNSDLFTINLNNNGGSNYSYTVPTLSDAFNRLSLNPGNNPALTYTSFSSNSGTVDIGVSAALTNFLRFTPPGLTSGRSTLTYPISSVPGMNAVLSSNTAATITWTFNFRTTRLSTFSGFNSSNYGAAVVLASTNADPLNATANGYALVYGGSTFRNFRLVRFAGGLTANANINDIIGSGVNDFSSASSYVSIRVVYIPSSNTWQLFSRDDGGTAWANPATGVTTQIGSNTVNSLYTGSTMSTGGFLYNYATTTTDIAMFDNLNITLAPAVAPAITSFSASPNTGSTTTGYIGSTVTVTGSGFLGTSIVRVGGSGGTTISSFTVVNDNTITFVIPSTAPTGQIYVQNSAGNNTSSGSLAVAGYRTAATGTWQTAATWLGGAVPPSANTTDVTIAHNVTGTTGTITVRNLTVNSATTLTNTAAATIDINGASTNSGTITNNGTISVTGVTYTNSGTFTIGNGATFQINQGGFLAGTALSYNATASTLVFNNTTGQYGVQNTHAYWPATNQPVTVTVLGAGGVQLQTGTTRTVTNLNLSAGFDIQSAGLLTLNGVLTINSGGSVSSNAPIYGASSTLLYNTTSNPYNVGTEWTGNSTTAGTGVPRNVTIQSSNNVVMPNSDRGMAGNLLIQGTSTLTLNATSGDLYVAGTVTNNSNFTHNSRALFLNGTGAQTISGAFATAGATNNLAYLILNNTGGSVTANSNLLITGTSGSTLQLLGGATFTIATGLNVTMSGTGGSIQVTGGTRTINFASNTASFIFTGNKSVTSTSSGLLSFSTAAASNGASVQLNGAGVDFGAGGITTIGNLVTLIVNSGGFVDTNPVTYATGSTLSFRTGNTYTVGASDRTWGPGTTGAGVPFNVNITTNAATNVVISDDRTARNVVTLNTGTLTNNTNVLNIATTLTTAANALVIAGGTLANGGGTMNMGPTGGGNQSLSLTSGAFTLTAGTVNINGAIAHSGGTFTMSGTPALNVDPNSGTTATSVASGTIIWSITGGTQAVTGGTITIVDPPNTGSAFTLRYNINGSSLVESWLGSTLVFGGTSGTNATTATLGFAVDTYVSFNRLLLGNVIANGGNTTDRYLSGPTSISSEVLIGGTLTINNGSEVRIGANAEFYLRGNLVNNGTLTSLNTFAPQNGDGALHFSQGTGLGSNTVAQTVTGTGVFRNSTTASTANFTGIEFNNTAGVDLSAIGSISASEGTDLVAGTVLLGNNADFTYTKTSPVNTRTSGYFILQGSGRVVKAYATGASSIFTYHIGENTGTTQYSPISLTFSANSLARNVGVNLVDGDHPQINNPVVPTDYLSRYWTLSDNGVGGTYSFTAQMTYIPTAEDVNGTEASIRAASYGTLWTDVHSSIASPTLTTTAITSGLNGLALTGRTAPVSYTWVGFTDGTWGTSTNWSPTGVPTSFDSVTLTNGSTGAAANLNLNSAVTVGAISFNGTGSFFTVGASGSITVTGAVTYTAGSGSWNATSSFIMSSSASQSIPPFNYGNLNATGGNRVWMVGTTGIAGTFTQGAGTYTPTVGSTVDYNGAGAQTIRNVAYYDLTNSSNTARTLANGTITIANSYTPTTNTITVGTSTIDFSSSGTQNIPASSYNTITNSGNGNRVWASSGNIDIAGSFSPGSGTHTVTGSTVRFINTAAGPTTIPVVTTTTTGISYNNVVINGTNGTPSVHSIYGTTVGIGGNLTITAGTLRLATTANAGTLNVFGTLTLNGGTLSLTNSGNLADAGILNLYGDLTMSSGTIARTSGVANATINFVNASGTQNWTYSGGSFSILSGTGIPVNVGNGTTTNTLQLASNVTASSITLNVLSGASINFGTNIFTSTGSMSFAANSGSNVITANTGGLASSGASGSVQSTGSRAFNTGANYTFNGSAAQITGTGFTGANNFTINNSAGVTLTASATVSGVTTLSSGVLALGANNLTVTNTGAGAFSGAGATSFIQTGSTGELRRSVPASIASSTTFDFPVGTSADYTPASFTFTATGNAFTLHTRAVAVVPSHPSMNSNGTQTDYIANRYWVTNTSGTPSTYAYSSQFTYITGDAQGTVANIKLNKWSGAWTEDSGSSATSTVLSSGTLNETTFSLTATAEWVGRANPTSVTYTWVGGTSADWGTAGNWSPNGVPSAIDNVIINAPGTSFDLSINSSRTINNFEISGTGNLSMTAAGSLTISGTVATSGTPSGTFDCASTVTISNGSSQPIPPLNYGNLNASGGNRTLPASGTVRVCGTFTPGSGTYTAGGGTFEYNGSAAQTIAAINYNNLTVSGDRGGATVTFASGTIDVAGTFSPTLSNYVNSIAGNTINFSSASSQNIPAFNYNSITNTGNGARVWASSGVIDINGTFSPGSGSQTVTGSSVRYSSTAATAFTMASFTSSAAPRHYNNLELVGGATTSWALASGFNMGVAGDFNMTGLGSLTVAPNATANVMTVDGNVVMSSASRLRIVTGTGAGTLNIGGNLTSTSSATNPIILAGGTGTAQISVTGNYSQSAGEVILQNSSTNTGVAQLSITGAANLTGTASIDLENTSSSTGSGLMIVGGNFSATSTSANIVDFGTGTVTGNAVRIAGDFSKSGTGTFFTTSTNAATGFVFNKAGTQTFSYSGASSDYTSYVINPGSTLQLLTGMAISLQGSPASSLTVNGALNAGTNVVSSAGTLYSTFTLASGGTLITANTGGVTSTVTGFASTTYNAGANYVFNGTATQSTGFPTSVSSMAGLTISNTAGVNLSKAVTVSSVLELTNGVLSLGNFDLTATSGVTAVTGGTFGSTRMIATNGTGQLKRTYASNPTASSFTWPIGEGSNYSPVTISLNAALTGTIGFAVTDGVPPNNGVAVNYLTRYWTASNTFSSYSWNGNFTYTPADIVGSEGSMKLNIWDPVNLGWTEYSTSSAASNVLTVSSGPGTGSLNNTTITGRTDVPTYYRSAAAGPATWGTAASWLISSDPAFVSPAGVAASVAPNNINSAGISVMSGHTINIGASVTADDLTIQSGGTLNHNTGTLTIANGTALTDFTIDGNYTSAASTVLQSGSATLLNGIWTNSSSALNNTGLGTATINGTFVHSLNAGTVLVGTWNTGSLLRVQNVTANAPSKLDQNFWNVEWNSTHTQAVSLSSVQNFTTIANDLTILNTGGSDLRLFSATASGTTTIGRNLTVTGGTLAIANSGTGNAGVQVTLSVSGDVLINGGVLSLSGSGTPNAANTTLNIGGKLEITSGRLDFNTSISPSIVGNMLVNLSGDLTISGTGTISRTANLANRGIFRFNKSTGTQVINVLSTSLPANIDYEVGNGTTTPVATLASDFIINNLSRLTVRSGATLDCPGSFAVDGATTTNGAFSLQTAATLAIGSPNGISTFGNTSGNIRAGNVLANRDFSSAGNYRYKGTANQTTGNGLPSTLTGQLSIANTGATGNNTVTLTTNNTTLAALNLQTGLFAAGAGQNINLSNGGVINGTGGDFATGATAGRVTIPTSVSAAFNGTSNPYEVHTSGGINFGAQTVTIQNGGTFRINSGGFVNTNAPFYGAGSTLQYWVGATYGRSLEWSASSGRGYPHHVQLSNNTTLNPANTGATQASTPLRTAGNLTIDSGSNLYMDSGGNNMLEDLVVGGNMILTGALSGSQTAGSDIFVGGNWQNDGTSANFFPNNRAVFLNGTGTQTISGTNVTFPAFPFLFIDKAAGSVSLSRDVQVTELLNFSAANVANIITGANTLFVSKNTTTAIERFGSGHVIGNLRRAVTNGSNTYDYPVGDATAYSPVSLALSNVTTSGSITASATSGDQAQIASSGLDASKSVNRFYTLTNTGVTLASYSPTFNFVSGDLDAGVNTSSLLVGLYTTSWSYPTVGTRTATSTQATGVGSFGQFALAECRAPIVYNVTGGGSYCASGSGVAVGLDGSDLGISYQLQRNGTDVGGSVAGTGTPISFGNQTPTGSYSVIANSSASTLCSQSMIGSVLVNINPVVTPAVTISTSASTICNGSSVTFTATPQFGGDTPVYQWKVNGSNVGTNSDTYATSTLLNGDIVTCDMTSNEACPSPTTVTSNSITMSVLPFGTPSLSIASASGTTLCLGDLISITSSPTFEGNVPSYDWKVNGTSTGETGTSYSTFSLVNGDQISCILTSDYLCANAPTATSNTLTFTVVTPPQVDAGNNLTTCGTTAYTFPAGATSSNTASIVWTENGAGSITAGANTLTPTYTPAAGDLGTTVTFTLTGLGNGPCAEIADNITLTISALTLYYVDADGDGFGNPLIAAVASCSPVTGRVADNTDCCDADADVNPLSEWWADVDGDGFGSFIFASGCISGCAGFASTIPYYPGAHGGAPYTLDCNDGSSSSFPGATEQCGNAVDDDCDGIVDEGCSGIANDEFFNAALISVNNTNHYYPNCTAVAGSLLNADPSSEANPANVASGAGRDSWFRFVAPSSAARIRVVPLGFDAVIELRTAAHPVGQVDVENVNSAIGGTEIMNVSGLTPGQTYYVAVRNYNNTSGGTFSICISPLMPSGCGTSQSVGGLSLCTSFKAVYRGATSYTFRFTGTGGTAPTPFATTSATSTGLMPLANTSLALRNGGVYSVRVDANYVLPNGLGVLDAPIVLQGTPCSRTIAAAPLMEVTATQRCATSTLNRSALLRATPTAGSSQACSASGYNFRFTRVADCVGTAIPGESPVVVGSSSAFLSLYVPFPNSTYPLPNLGYWKVEIAPVFSYGATAYGPAQIIQVNNTAASPMAPEIGNPEERLSLSSELLSVYPNPGNGDYAVVQIDGNEGLTNWSVIDELGRRVEGHQVSPIDANRYEIRFANSIANGLYFISCVSNGEVKSVRWLVSR